MKRIFLLATAGLMIASCSNNDKEDTATPTSTEIHTEERMVTAPVQPVDTGRTLSSPTIAPPHPDHTNAARADIRSSRSSSTSTNTAPATVAGTAPAAAPADGNESRIVAKKGQEEEAMRRKIHENNSIDGGGQ